MSKEEILKAIKNAEKDAAKTISDAEAKASSILSEARVKATEIIQTSQDDINKKSRDMINEARSNAQMDADKVTNEGDSVIQKITEKGKKDRKNAVDSVISSFMN